MASLELTNLEKRYGSFYAVKNLNLTVNDGEIVCLLGPSGCGKTTTLRMIGGFIRPDGGDIAVDGASVTTQPPERRPTGMVFQRYTLWPHMNVWHNVAFGLKLRKLPKAEISRKVEDALTLVGLPGTGKRYPSQLSGGQQQRVALARALVLEPRILLLDEPFSNLDALLRVRMREELLELQRRVGITTVFVTHDQTEALAIADRIVVMKDGVIEQVAPPTELYNTPSSVFVATFVGNMNLIPAKLTSEGTVQAGPFRLEAPRERPASGEVLTVGIRPEDLHLGPAGSGEIARVTQISNLGHYRQVSLVTSDGLQLTAFQDKGEEMPGEQCGVSIDSALLYDRERLVAQLSGRALAHA